MTQGRAARDESAIPAARSPQGSLAHGGFLGAVLAHLTDALVACDAHGQLTLFNPAAQRLHGLPATAIESHRWPQHYRLFHADGCTLLEPDDLPLLRALRGEVVRNVEMVVAPTGGVARSLLASGQQIVGEDGQLRGAVIVMHDVTALRAAAQLRAQQTLDDERRRSTERALSRLQQLNAAALAVNRQRTVAGVLDAINEQAAAVIGAQQAVASLTRGDDWAQAITSVVMADRYEQWRAYDEMPDGSGIYAMVCETNRAVRLTQQELEQHPRWRAFGEHAPNHPPMRGWLAAPLVRRDGSNLGLIQLSDKRGDDPDPAQPDQAADEFDGQDEALLVQLAQLASLALEKAVEFEREHQVAVALQRSLLPHRLECPPGLRAHVEYLPGLGEADLSVGGDFYDLFDVGGGRVALALGDVVGHGLRSASLMGQIRSGLRALAMKEPDPAEVLPALDRLVATLGEEAMATLAYGVLDVASGELRLALAGHPPPLLRTASGVLSLAAEPGLPLGALLGTSYPTVEYTLPVGASLLMYSDGLVENRHRSLTAGLAQLQGALASAPADLDRLCAHVIAELTGGKNDDDVALLAIERH